MPAMAHRLDRTHLRQEWLPRLDRLVYSADFAHNRYRVQGVYICAIVLSQDGPEIRNFLTEMPKFSVTQDALDWQPNEEEQSVGTVFGHLMRMSASNDCRSASPDSYIFENVEAPEFAPAADDSAQAHSCYRQSFRLSSLEVINGDYPSPGYHVGATSFQKLTELRDGSVSDEKCSRWLFKYLRDLDESPKILWAREGVTSAVLWQVQVDVVDSTSRLPDSCRRRDRRRRYGVFAQVYEDDSSSSLAFRKEDEEVEAREAKRLRGPFRGVRWRRDRRKWVAETRLPKGLKKNKVWFGEYDWEEQAARAVDVAFHHYGRPDRVNFGDTATILATQPALEGLEEDEKLKRVQEQAKWVALNAPSPKDGSPSQRNADPPEAASSQTPAATPAMIPSSLSPSTSLESLIGSNCNGSADDEGSPEVAPQHVMELGDIASFAAHGQAGQSLYFQFLCSVAGTDLSDFMASCSPSSPWSCPVDSRLGFYDDDDADHRMVEQESVSIWEYDRDGLFSGL